MTPTFTYYTGNTPNGTPLSGAPTSAGTYTVVASFAGIANYNSANSNPVTFKITVVTATVTVADAGGVFNGCNLYATPTEPASPALGPVRKALPRRWSTTPAARQPVHRSAELP